MLKKFYTGLMTCLMAVSATGGEIDLLPYYSPELSWSGASLNGTTLMWESAWGGVVFNMNNADYSEQNFVIIDFAEPVKAKMKLEAYYDDQTEATTSTEVESGADRAYIELDPTKKTNIQKIAILAAKPGNAEIAKAVMTDIYEVDPVLFEGSTDIPDLKKIYFRLGADKFAGIKSGDRLTVYFSTGDLQNYASLDFYSDKKLECNDSRSNIKGDGNFKLGTTSTTVTVKSDSDINSLKTKGLTLKGRNITVTKIILNEETPDQPEPGPGPSPEQPDGTLLWSGNNDTGKWSNDVVVEASKFTSVKTGDIIRISLKVNPGSDYGNIELADEKYTKLAMDGTSADLDKYGCIQPDVTSLSYSVAQSDVNLLKTNGLRVKGANITVTGIAMISSATPEPVEPTEGSIWHGNNETGNWKNDVVIEPSSFAGSKAGDYIIITLSVNNGADYGNIELNDKNYSKLATNGSSPELDAYGCIQPGVTSLSYIITNSDIKLLQSNGLRVKGANITITDVALKIGTALEPDPEPVSIEVLWTGNVNCGKWAETISVEAEKFAEAKENDKVTIYLTRNTGKGSGQIEVQTINGLSLDMNGNGTNTDGSGKLVSGATEVAYTLNASDMELLKNHGLLIKGLAITVTKVALMDMGVSGIDEVIEEDTPVEYYNLNGMKVIEPSAGIYIRRKGNNVTKVVIR